MALKVVQTVIAFSVACVGLLTYWRGTRTKAAEFLAQLHKDFFVEETYKEVRTVLDDTTDAAHETLKAYINDQPAAFTDFLNFFELVAYMGSGGQMLSRKDVLALLGYYLKILTRQPLRDYIRDAKNDYQHLDRLLTQLEKS